MTMGVCLCNPMMPGSVIWPDRTPRLQLRMAWVTFGAHVRTTVL